MKTKLCSSKRTVFARLDAGDDLLLSLKQCATEHGIRSAWFSVIGGLKELAYGLYEQGQYKNIHRTAKHCFELLPTFGNITQKEGDVLVHAHVIAGNEDDGGAFGGHLLEGSKIYPFAEVVMQEVDITIGRDFDPKLNLWPMRF